MTWSRFINVRIGGTTFTDDVVDGVEVSMGAQSPWEQSVNGSARISLLTEQPDVAIGDDVIVSVESPEEGATGGTVTTATVDGVDYMIHTFTSSGTFTLLADLDVEYLVVGAGGGGGRDVGGGGGAGGFVTNLGTPTPLTAGSYTITVGTGGAPASSNTQSGRKGGDSAFGTVATATGGGGGKSRSSGVDQSAGGSGGGGAWTLSAAADSRPGGLGTAGQGNDGGDGSPNIGAAPYRSGGGGGAGEAGQDAAANSGDGGDGLPSTITGTSVYYAGGGGGGLPFAGGGAGLGGLGGGANGGTTTPAPDGVDGLGGGGGGGRTGGVGGSGGDGIVIIRYPDPTRRVFTGTVAAVSTVLFDFGPVWTVQATGPLTKAGRRAVTATVAAAKEGDQIAELVELALSLQWQETFGEWQEQAGTWASYAADLTDVDQPGLYDLAAIDSLPANVLDELATCAVSGSGWLYETAHGTVGYADSTRRENTPEDEYYVVPGDAVRRDSFQTFTDEGNLANDIVVQYDGGTVEATDATSLALYGKWQRTYDTTLADVGDAVAYAARRLELESAPRTNLAAPLRIELSQVSDAVLDQLLAIQRNDGVIIQNTPTYISAEGLFRGFIEGYLWLLNPIQPTLDLFVSDYNLSNFGLRWAAAGPTRWTDVGASIAWQDATEALA